MPDTIKENDEDTSSRSSGESREGVRISMLFIPVGDLDGRQLKIQTLSCLQLFRFKSAWTLPYLSGHLTRRGFI